MGGIGGMELLVIGVVALIVVGPKDLPGMFRTLGQFTAKARGMAREFTQAMEAAADEAGVKDVSKTLRDAANPKKMGLDAVRKATSFDIDPNREKSKPAAKAASELPPERAAAAGTTQAATAKAADASKAREAEPDLVRDPAAPKPETAAKTNAKPKTNTEPKAETKTKLKSETPDT